MINLRLLQTTTVLCLTMVAMQANAQGVLAGVAGKITDENGFGIAQAEIILKNESTGFTTTGKTNEAGDYAFKQLPLGGPYSVRIIMDEFGEELLTGYMLSQGDLVWVPFQFKTTDTALQEVVVNGRSLKSTIKSAGASTAVTEKDLKTLPVNGRNFTSLMDLSPLSNGQSIGGQLASSVDYTIDGMSNKGSISGGATSAAYSISMEAIREFKVVTNEYDVTNGRAGGGTISTVTKSGTNKFAGSAFLFGRADWLSSPNDIKGNRRKDEFSTYQYGFSFSGPIKKDKAHFFVAWDRQSDARPLYIANINGPDDEADYKVTQSTLNEFLSIARDQYGVAQSDQFGSFDKKKETDAVFARIDWQINPKNLLTIRNNFIYEKQDQAEGDNTAINLYEVYNNRKKLNNSLMASLRTDISSRLINELKVQYFMENEDVLANTQLPKASIPRAIVKNVSSEVEGKKPYLTSIQLGGQRYTPEWFKGDVFQIVDNVYLTTEKAKYTFGADLSYYRMHDLYGSEMNGRFYFTGMENFRQMRPDSYAREITMVDDASTVINQLSTAVYGQMETSLAPGLDGLIGLRIENVHYMDRANYNEVADKQLGVRTDEKISTWQIQPRFQLTWDVGERRTDYIKLGGGIFGSSLNPYSMINNMLFDGTKVASVNIEGDLAPTPNFPGYRDNPLSAPGRELFDIPGVEKLITINANSKDAKVPLVYKLSASYNHFFNDRLKVGITAYANWARNNYMYVDRNMVDEPFFRIKDEGNRGVYVPSNTINTKNGYANWANGRKTNDLGRVLELVSEGKKDQYAIVVDGTYRYYKEGQISVSYTWNDSKDNTSYNGNVANSATLSLMVPQDPRDLSQMSYSDTHFTHKVVVYGSTPSFWGITAGLRFSGIGGTRYSLAVNGNVNGDFVDSNDLAFIYDPNDAKTPQYLRDGITAILNNPDVEKSTKEYIRKSFGKIAERNGGVNPFNGYFDLRLAKALKIIDKQQIELSVDIFNVANLLNKEWGTGPRLGKQNIYTVKSFDKEEERFVYDVNQNAGKTAFSRTPYQIQLGLRYSF